MAKNTKKKRVAINVRQTVSEAFTTIMLEQLEYLSMWEEKARDWQDIEGVHQMRVALRRMRSAIETFHPVFSRELMTPWSEQMRWCAEELGPARDLDVFIGETLAAVADRLPLAGAVKLEQLARQQREQSYAGVTALLDDERYANFKSGLKIWLDSQGWLNAGLNAKARQKLQTKITPFARKRLQKLEHKVYKQKHAIDPNSPADLHQLRIHCKKLRYAAEFFSPLFSQDLDKYIIRLKALQVLLGTMNDIDVMQRLLDGLLAKRRDRELLRYAGGLIGWRAHEYHIIKESFAGLWQQFISGKLAACIG
jgi:CHAD domain-containing protein